MPITSRSRPYPFTNDSTIPKESNDVSRKRIEEDLKESAAQYTDYAENKISKLREAYIKKYYSW